MLGQKEDLLQRTLIAHEINILDDALRPDGPSVSCSAKIRYNHQPVPATARLTAPDELTVTFAEPQSAITPGQAVVLYDGDCVLAGGWIHGTAE